MRRQTAQTTRRRAAQISTARATLLHARAVLLSTLDEQHDDAAHALHVQTTCAAIAVLRRADNTLRDEMRAR